MLKVVQENIESNHDEPNGAVVSLLDEIVRDGAVDLSRRLGHPVHPGLIYAGPAGATRANGRKSKNTLWGRIKTMHLGGGHEFSTFRLSLGSILAEASRAAEINEQSLTGWMHAHPA